MNLAASYADAEIRDIIRELMMTRTSLTDFTGRASSGFIGSGFRVNATSPIGMSVKVASGLGFIDDPTDVPTAINSISGLNDVCPYKPVILSSDETIAVPAADPANPRIDIVEVKIDRRVTDSASRDILDTATGIFVPAAVYKTLTFNLSGRSSVNGSSAINYKTGTPAASPVAPAPTAGYVKIAQVNVAALAASLAQNTIVDSRNLVWPGGGFSGQATLAITNGATAAMQAACLPPGVIAFPKYLADATRTYASAFYLGIGGATDNSLVAMQFSTLSALGGTGGTGASLASVAAYGGTFIKPTAVTADATLQGVAAAAGVQIGVGQKLFLVALDLAFSASGYAQVPVYIGISARNP